MTVVPSSTAPAVSVGERAERSASGRDAPAPMLSVLVTQHHRHRFLGEALASVESQSLSPGSYEVVVVRDFDEPGIDRQLARMGARDLRFESDNMGEIMVQGLRACRGKVVCFLDDDDRFTPHKLRTVLGEFERRSDLGYLHNGLTYIREDGRPLDGEDPWSEARAQRMSRDWGFCSSCISVRRELLRPLLDRWPEVPRAPDSFVDYVSRVSPFSRVLTVEPLTQYRVHPRSNSRKTNHAVAYLSIARILKSMPRSRARERAVSSILGYYMSASVRGRSRDRRGATWALLQLAAAVAPGELRPNAREVACGLLLPFSPSSAVRLYTTWRRGRVDWLPLAEPAPVAVRT